MKPKKLRNEKYQSFLIETNSVQTPRDDWSNNDVVMYEVELVRRVSGVQAIGLTVLVDTSVVVDIAFENRLSYIARNVYTHR